MNITAENSCIAAGAVALPAVSPVAWAILSRIVKY